MSRGHWLSHALVILFLYYAVITPVHTVHHSLHDAGSQGCPIATVLTHTNGELPNTVPLPTWLPCADLVSILDPPLPRTAISHIHRNRGPPSLSS